MISIQYSIDLMGMIILSLVMLENVFVDDCIELGLRRTCRKIGVAYCQRVNV